MEEKVRPYHQKAEAMAFYNQQKVLAAFRENQLFTVQLHNGLHQ